MAERMLVTQALDERDLLAKKIRNKIIKASFVDTKKNNEERAYQARVSAKEFAGQAEASYQQIMDLIRRFQNIDAAIVASNAITFIETSYGKFSVAGAISLRNRIRSHGPYMAEGDFEGNLYNQMLQEYKERLAFAEDKNRQLHATAEEMRISILGRDSKGKDEKPLEVVEAYVRENTTELVDPLGILKKMEELKEKREVLLRELDTQIKVANATTFVEV